VEYTAEVISADPDRLGDFQRERVFTVMVSTFMLVFQKVPINIAIIIPKIRCLEIPAR